MSNGARGSRRPRRIRQGRRCRVAPVSELSRNFQVIYEQVNAHGHKVQTAGSNLVNTIPVTGVVPEDISATVFGFRWTIP
jgi:hypothetical protein